MLTCSSSQVWIQAHGTLNPVWCPDWALAHAAAKRITLAESSANIPWSNDPKWPVTTCDNNRAFIVPPTSSNSPLSAARPHEASEASFWTYLSPKPPTWVLHGAPHAWDSASSWKMGYVNGFYHDELPCDWPSNDEHDEQWTPGLNCLAAYARHGKTWQDMARHGKTWQDMARHGKTWQDMGRHGKTWQDMARHGKTWQNKNANDLKWPWLHRSWCNSVAVSRPCCDASWK